MSWKLYDEVNQNNTRNYSVYRCPDPVAIVTQTPWYSYSNVCPCDPNLSNPSGRGFTACPQGLNQTQNEWNLPDWQITSQIPWNSQLGSLYNQHQYVPPQLNPYPVTQIGYSWRSPN